MAGLERGKYAPAVIFGPPDENRVQPKMTVAERDGGTVIPLQIPGFNAPSGPAAKPLTKADLDTLVKSHGW